MGHAEWTAQVDGQGVKTATGWIGFDRFEVWTDEAMIALTLHELGHAIGLSHNNSKTSVMYGGDEPHPFITTLDEAAKQRARSVYP